MAKRSKAAQLPAELRDELVQKLTESGFGNYDALMAWLREKAAALGIPAEKVPRRSSLARYGANLEKRLAQITASTEAARQIAAIAPDDADQRSAAVISMIQTQIFDVLVNAQALNDERDPAKRMKLLSALSGNVAKLAKASIGQKKHELDIRAKVQASADAAAKIAKKGGLTAAGVDAIRRQILGIAG
jgi:hypothetical protein